ncbi:MAG: PDZ domain-containing protein, partial [Paracoccaceae bacterium]|nr:PDZ domain-containing protein [Paracoccaceae bacterium]
GELEVGELVLAIGNPFGVGQTVTSGIVSGLARSGAATGSARGYFIQTDAAINPGNSGGALVDMDGRLVGINTSILTRSGGSNGIGFAIPSNLVARFVALAAEGATGFERPWAGIGGQPVTGDLAESLGLDRPEGFLVAEIHPESPFAAAGIRVGDVILSLDGVPVSAPQDLIYHLSVAGPGSRVVAEFLRDGRRREAAVRLDAPPGDAESAPVIVPPNLPLAGLAVADLTPRLLAEFGLPVGAEGVVVLAPGARGARGGLRSGDVILAVNGQAVETAVDVAQAAAEGGRNWYFDVVRQGRRVRLLFRL